MAYFRRVDVILLALAISLHFAGWGIQWYRNVPGSLMRPSIDGSSSEGSETGRRRITTITSEDVVNPGQPESSPRAEDDVEVHDLDEAEEQGSARPAAAAGHSDVEVRDVDEAARKGSTRLAKGRRKQAESDQAVSTDEEKRLRETEQMVEAALTRMHEDGVDELNGTEAEMLAVLYESLNDKPLAMKLFNRSLTAAATPTIRSLSSLAQLHLEAVYNLSTSLADQPIEVLDKPKDESRRVVDHLKLARALSLLSLELAEDNSIKQTLLIREAEVLAVAGDASAALALAEKAKALEGGAMADGANEEFITKLRADVEHTLQWQWGEDIEQLAPQLPEHVKQLRPQRSATKRPDPASVGAQAYQRAKAAGASDKVAAKTAKAAVDAWVAAAIETSTTKEAAAARKAKAKGKRKVS